MRVKKKKAKKRALRIKKPVHKKRPAKPAKKAISKTSTSFSRSTLREIEQVAQSAPFKKIVQGKNYLYFSLQPTQEEITIKAVYKKPHLKCYAVKNFKKSIIAYIVQLSKKPQDICIHEFGVAIFYSKVSKAKNKKVNFDYKNLKVPFSDAKFRIIALDSKDYFVSVKWRSNNPTE
jgi:hypothetical protein